MTTLALDQFIDQNADELVRRCQDKVAKRQGPVGADTGTDAGVPLFLAQLCQELRHGPSTNGEISRGATAQGHELLTRGFTISQVVHGYGDVCQSITDLAVEMHAPISTDDFRTLNRCLDDAIAGAVTEFSRSQDVTRDGESHEMRDLIKVALAAFEVLQTGNVGVGGSTGAVVLRSLQAMDALMHRQSMTAAPATSEARLMTAPSSRER